jgi:hypothetical protein
MPDIQPMSLARRYLGAGLAQPAGEGVNPSTPAMLVYVRAADGGRRARMLIERLDRTQWRLSQAIDHVATQIERAVVRGELAQLCDRTAPPWRRAEAVMSVMCGCPLRVKVDELRWAGEHGCGDVLGL